jgi:cytochrome d ubiquinol oxidase subunit II
MERAQAASRKLWIVAVVVLLLLLVATFFYTDILSHAGAPAVIVAALSFIGLLAVGYFVYRHRQGWAFALAGLHIILAVVACFWIMFPRVIISSLDPANDLTIYNASSTPYTLQVMTIVAVIFVPVVLAYQIWTYWVFRKRISNKPQELIY